MKFQIIIDDNYHFMDASERSNHRAYNDYGAAVAACRHIVDRSLDEVFEPGMTAKALYAAYLAFGEDPWISPVPEGETTFSASAYAKRRCRERCGEGR